MNRCCTVDFSFQLATLLSVFITAVDAIICHQREVLAFVRRTREKDDAFAVTVVVRNIMQALKHQVRKETF